MSKTSAKANPQARLGAKGAPIHDITPKPQVVPAPSKVDSLSAKVSTPPVDADTANARAIAVGDAEASAEPAGNIENITLVGQAISGCLGTIEQEREQEVLARRFGLTGQRETLESIGKRLGITRERVRQLEKVILVRLRISSDENLIPNLSGAEKIIVRNLVELGRVAPVTTLAERIFGRSDPVDAARLNFIADISSLLTTVGGNDSYFEAIGIAENGGELEVKHKIDVVVEAIKATGQPVPLEDLFEKLSGYEHPAFLEATAKLSKKLAHRGNLWGLKTWPEVNPRTIRDKIFIILTEEKRPIHFTELAHIITANDPTGHVSTVQAVHNELIKDPRFMLVGRGIYALRSWGMKEGTVPEVVEQILTEHKGPMQREAIIKAVLKNRVVKETTVLLALQNRKLFTRVGKDHFGLRKK